MNERIKIESYKKPEITIASSKDDFIPMGNLDVLIDGVPIVTVHYVYPYIDNAGVHTLAEKIAKMLGQ